MGGKNSFLCGGSGLNFCKKQQQKLPREQQACRVTSQGVCQAKPGELQDYKDGRLSCVMCFWWVCCHMEVVHSTAGVR